jgi:hypothetical protein
MGRVFSIALSWFESIAKPDDALSVVKSMEAALTIHCFDRQTTASADYGQRGALSGNSEETVRV